MRLGLKLSLALSVALVTNGCLGYISSPEEDFKYRRVRPAVAFEILRDTEGLLILDLRSRERFDSDGGHLAGATSIPLLELEGRLSECEEHRSRTVVVYCDGGECDRAGIRILHDAGFERAVLIEGGIDAWQTAGFGTMTSAAEADAEADAEASAEAEEG